LDASAPARIGRQRVRLGPEALRLALNIGVELRPA
jgi:hypothetical protein